MRSLLLACLVAVIPSAASGGSLLIESIPTPDLAGFKTYTFSIELEPGEAFRGVDATFDGPMNQVNLLGNASVFSDSSKFFPFLFDWDPFQDSQFLSVRLTCSRSEQKSRVRF